MTWLDFREPVSAWTHFTWLVLSLPAMGFLWHLARGSWLKRIGVLVFALTCAACYTGSWLYHAVPESISEPFHVFDHVAIYLFIAGTVTPIGLVALSGKWRLWLLVGIWVMAVSGVVLRVTAEPSIAKGTLFYLAMGWIGVMTYFELARRLTHLKLWALWAGGGFYTVGAIINSLHWPAFAPGVFGSHELFHLFVMAGTGCHYCFMLTVVALPLPQPPTSPVLIQAEGMPLGSLAPEVATSRRHAAEGI